jgi:hypothetical protein
MEIFTDWHDLCNYLSGGAEVYIKPRVIVLDETEYWDTALVEQAGKIYGVHLFDANQVTHLCEFAGSYELNPLECAILNYETCPEEVCDEIDEQWRMHTDVSYMHVSDVRRVFDLPTQRCKADEYDEAWEAIMEHYQGNMPYYKLPEEA